jgi:hypothetical protein
MHLYIGSHDSCADILDWHDAIGNDQPKWLQQIGSRLSIVRRIVYRWSITQRWSITEQMHGGIRYWDMRLSLKPTNHRTKQKSNNNDDIRIVHGLYGRSVSTIFDEMMLFLCDHQQELLILDFNHFYNFNHNTHRQLFALIEQKFTIDRLCPYTPDASLKSIWSNRYQIIVIYACTDPTVKMPTWIWKNEYSIDSPWPNTNNRSVLMNFLQQSIDTRPIDNHRFFVTQGILTPQFSDVFRHLTDSLEHRFATMTTDDIVHWIDRCTSSPSLAMRFNIIICDFVQNFHFCQSIIQLNYCHHQSTAQ